MAKKRLLLTGIVGPFGVKDKYAEALGMQMEILNNQVTREQSVHSHRSNYWSYGLYMMAENISVPTTVLDFPKWKDFVKELKKGYSHVGISFIVANVLKAKRMAEYIREHYPKTKIILGGFGTMIPEIKEIVPYDAICPGEGIKWLREYFGEDGERPVKQTFMTATLNRYLYGYGIKDMTVALFPGLGCKNGCYFCATTHKFCGYVPYIKTGREMFDACLAGEKRLGVQSMGIMDENFLNDPKRVIGLLEEMEKHSKPYVFSMFSSAETVRNLGIDFMVRLGADVIWIGAESKKEHFKKSESIDLKKLMAELRENGISVIASTILFFDHHDEAGLEEEIDWAISLEADMHQFAVLTAQPSTPLWFQYDKEGRLIKDYPRMHAQGKICFRHPHFKPEEGTELLRQAFRKKYEAHGPSTLNLAFNLARGYKQAVKDFKEREGKKLSWNPKKRRYEKMKDYKPDKFMQLRIEAIKREALLMRPILLATKAFAPNRKARKKSNEVIALYNEVFGKQPILEKSKSAGLLAFAAIEMIRRGIYKTLRKSEFVRQPSCILTEYKGGKNRKCRQKLL